MANFYVTHHKFPTNPQYFTVTLQKVAGFDPEENPNFSPKVALGEEYWKVFIYTTGLDSFGELVGPVVAGVTGSAQTVNEFVEDKIADLCALIDWSQQGEFSPESDSSAPYISEQFPLVGQTDVPITSPVVLRVRDYLPGTGIDSSTVVMKIDGHLITPDVTGTKYDSTFSFSPKPILGS